MGKHHKNGSGKMRHSYFSYIAIYHVHSPSMNPQI